MKIVNIIPKKNSRVDKGKNSTFIQKDLLLKGRIETAKKKNMVSLLKLILSEKKRQSNIRIKFGNKPGKWKMLYIFFTMYMHTILHENLSG